jgi:transcriptional regulator with XRE-family HTH domain
MFTSSTNPSFLSYLAEAQAACGKSDEQMAQELGFSRASVYAAVKASSMKFPAGKLMILAQVLDASPSQLLEAFLRDQSPDLLDAVRKVWGPTGLTKGEQKLVEAYRHLTGGRDVEPVIMDGKDVLALITA